MPILKLDGKMVFYFGEGDIVFSSAYDKGDSEDNDYISFWQSETSYPIGKPMPELIGKEVDDWAVKMYFPSVESLQSVISVLVGYRDKKYPPKSEQGDSKNSSQAVQHLKAKIAAMQKVLDSDEAKGKYKISIVVVNNWLRQLSAVE